MEMQAERMVVIFIHTHTHIHTYVQRERERVITHTHKSKRLSLSDSDGVRGAAGEEEGEEVGAQGPDAHSGNTAGVSCESRARIIGNSPLTLAASGVGDGVEMGHEDTLLPLTMLSLGDISDAAAASHLRPRDTSPPLTFPSFPGHILTGFQTLSCLN